LAEFDKHFLDEDVVAFRNKVRMVLDPEVDGAYPRRWLGRVVVETRDGRHLEGRVDEPKGDPGNTLSRDELEEKARSLSAYAAGASRAEVQKLINFAWHLERLGKVGRLT
jgi:2-methylcitrate dehydratase PrpD